MASATEVWKYFQLSISCDHMLLCVCAPGTLGQTAYMPFWITLLRRSWDRALTDLVSCRSLSNPAHFQSFPGRRLGFPLTTI